MPRDWPAGLIALTIWAYWGTVVLLVVYRRVRHGQRSGVVPRDRQERRLWFAIVPVVLAWNVLPAVAATTRRGLFGLPHWADGMTAVFAVRSAAAALGVICYLITVYCWLLMGRSWSMAVVPRQKTELVTRGIYAWVRHPIYALSIALMLCTAIVAPTIPMLAVAAVHLVVMNLKARNEERHLTERHGASYTAYCGRVGRFFPRLRPAGGRGATDKAA